MAKHVDDDQDITKEIDVSAFQNPTPFNMQDFLVGMARAINEFKTASTHFRDGVSILEKSYELLAAFHMSKN